MKKSIKRLNNKGFTLIEVLAVIVILVIILAIAIPNITASLDRQSCKTSKNKADVILTAAKLYVGEHRNAVKNTLSASGSTCKIEITELEKSSDLTIKDFEDADSKEFSGFIVVKNNGGTYEYINCLNDNGCEFKDSTCSIDFNTSSDCAS